MAEYFVAQSLLRHYQLYQEPPGSLWHDCHLLYWLGERQHCLDEPVAAAFQPAAAGNLRGLYQQSLLLALSNPFQLENGQCLQLFAALAPLAELARLQPWEADDDSEGLLIDLGAEQPQLLGEPDAAAEPATLRRLELLSSLSFIVLLVWWLAAGDIFVAKATNEGARGGLALVLVITVISVLASLYRERTRIRVPAPTAGAHRA